MFNCFEYTIITYDAQFLGLNLTKVLTFASSKGGAGKSTLCVNLSAYFATLGKQVMILDVDPQRSSYEWITESSESILSEVSAIHLTDESEIEAIIAETGCDLVCIDLQGVLDNSPLFALAIADLILVPCRPSRDDIVGLGWIIKLNEAASVKYQSSEAEIRVILNAVNPRSVVYQHVMQQIKNDDIFVLSSPISQTVSFAEANINRVSVLEMSGKAKKMISKVGEEISSYLFK